MAPLSFVVFLLGVGGLCFLCGVDFNSASAVVVPVIVLTAGTAASYLVAGVIRMPIAFWLRRHDRLNASTIHLSALVWSLAFAAGAGFLLSECAQNWLVISMCILCTTSPSILLAGTAFWALIREG